MEVFFFAGTNFRVRATGREKRENLNLAKITRYTVATFDHLKTTGRILLRDLKLICGGHLIHTLWHIGWVPPQLLILAT